MSTEKKIEDLLKPRYKVIADYPFMPYREGEILIPYGTNGIDDFVDHGNRNDALYANRYPHLFKPLQWWEERSIEEMPEYVKETGMVDSFNNPVPDVVLKIKGHFSAGNGNWRDDSFKVFYTEESQFTYSGFEPATLEDYQSYINNQK